MANELYIYTTPSGSTVVLRLDSGEVISGVPCSANNRHDAHRCTLPANLSAQGAVLEVSCDGYVTFANRGVILPAEDEPALFMLDDVHLTDAPTAPAPGPEPPPESDPLTLIQAVYATGEHDLSTKEGCGRFTEACCTSLHDHNSEAWMHDKRTPPQNNYNGHAVDAIQCIAGQYYGMWDIIHSSVSPDASPCFNLAGPPNPGNAFYPAAPTNAD